MSDGLISRKALKQAIDHDFYEHYTKYHDTDQIALIDMVMDDIDEMPVAFDKEEVIKELQKHSHNYYPSIDHYCTSVKAVKLRDVIDIIEKGR